MKVCGFLLCFMTLAACSTLAQRQDTSSTILHAWFAYARNEYLPSNSGGSLIGCYSIEMVVNFSVLARPV